MDSSRLPECISHKDGKRAGRPVCRSASHTRMARGQAGLSAGVHLTLGWLEGRQPVCRSASHTRMARGQAGTTGSETASEEGGVFAHAGVSRFLGLRRNV